MNALDIHELAALIPPMSADEYEALRSDVAKQGLIEPIITFEGKILDGRHRYEACQETGTEARFGQYDGTDPVAFVISANVHRRHLTASQKAVVALDVEVAYAKVIPKGRPSQEVSQCWETSRAAERAAQTVGVSKGYVSDAKKVQREAPDLLLAISAGTMTVPKAAKEIRRREKIKRVAEIAAQAPAPLGSIGPFPVLYADPPWRYSDAEPSRRVENHYPTMALDEIKALGSDLPATEDAVLFLWATSPKLLDALEVMKAWGFDYKTCAVSTKDKIGMGYYFRQQHELLLVGTRGSLRCPDPEDRASSVIAAPRGLHSAKPPIVYEVIETMYPTAERVELFARQERDGWASWGNQVEAAA